MAGPHRPLPPLADAMMYTGGWRRSLARSADVVITATAPSVSMRVVEQAQRLGDHPGVEVVVERERLLLQRGGPLDRVLALRDRDLGEVLPLRAVEVHVALGEHREAVARRQQPGVGAERGARRHAAATVGTASTLRHRRVREHPVDLGAPQALVQLLERHQRHADVGHAAVDGRGGEPERAGATAAAGGEAGGEAHLGHPEHRRHLGGVARVRVDGEAVEVVHRQPGVVERAEDRGARHRQLGLRVRLAPLVVRRRADAHDRGLVLDAHETENSVLRSWASKRRGHARP